MGVSIQNFIDAVEKIYQKNPRYERGHDGSDGLCDCIGLIKGALRQNGTEPKGLKGVNWAQRHTIMNQQPVGDGSGLRVGQVVIKALQPGEDGYDLPDNYKKGGADYNGDLTDYNHIGVVTSINPLVITHMTSPNAKKDTKVGKWKIAGKLPQVDYGSEPQPEPTPEPTPEPEPTPDPEPVEEPLYGYVYAANGHPVKMRAKPSTNCNLYDELPVGTLVEVLDRTDTDWYKINGGMRKGWYMMCKFIQLIDNPDEPDDPMVGMYNIMIQGLSKDEALALKEKYPKAEVTVG